MTRLLSFLSVACLGSALAACSTSARVPSVSAVGSAGPQTLDSARAGSSDCAQELGADTGGVVDAAPLIKFGVVDGCITERDAVDGFVVHVEDDMPLQVKLKSLSDHGAIRVEVFDVDGGKLAADSAGSFETRKLRFDVEGETDLFIRLEAQRGARAGLGLYRLVVGPDKRLARN